MSASNSAYSVSGVWKIRKTIQYHVYSSKAEQLAKPRWKATVSMPVNSNNLLTCSQISLLNSCEIPIIVGDACARSGGGVLGSCGMVDV
jgi:hypothetical protein